jgi:murein L,D-transpeptidase YcbB/YkuD
MMFFACVQGSAWAQENNFAEQIEPERVSHFQASLNRLGVSFTAPRKGKAILVNIPAFELIAFAEGEPVFRSRTIVGAPWHRTPIMDTYTSVVRFRPTWRPTPPMIASGKYRDRIWPPGLKNPLGLAAVRLQPGLLIYLHDTNHRELFEHDMRALSHGCIRVQQWDKVIAWILDIEMDEVHRLANGARTVDVAAPNIPVTLGYFTKFPNDAGKLVEYEDIYKRNSSGANRSLGNSTSQTVAQNDCIVPKPSTNGELD